MKIDDINFTEKRKTIRLLVIAECRRMIEILESEAFIKKYDSDLFMITYDSWDGKNITGMYELTGKITELRRDLLRLNKLKDKTRSANLV